MRTYIASALDGPVGIAIGRRLAEEIDASTPEAERLAHGLATQRLFRETIAAEECALEGDLLHEAPGPGLGVVIDEDSLRHHRL
jgi:L-alanine-DL-glutamate epimerase-like enolase superfamily enzyme